MTFIPRDDADLAAIMAEVDMCEDWATLKDVVRFLDKDKYEKLYEHVQRRLYEIRDDPLTIFPIRGFQSPMFQKTEQELKAYNIPITKIIEDNSLKDIQEIQDQQFEIAMESARAKLT